MSGSARVAFVAIALLSGFTVAAAADTGMSAGTCSAKGRLASSASLWQPTNKLSLPVEQRVTAWEDIRQQGTTAKAPAGYVAKVGAAVPDTIATHPVPISTSMTCRSSDRMNMHCFQTSSSSSIRMTRRWRKSSGRSATSIQPPRGGRMTAHEVTEI